MVEYVTRAGAMYNGVVDGRERKEGEWKRSGRCIESAATLKGAGAW